ncbi:MAG: hypothetical protein J1E64_03295 [Acetatifactor sp.]|nr:hypothetical protein [Acetatifactor sp.]
MRNRLGGLFIEDYYHIPRVCNECGGVMIFKGVGEYHCEKCGAVDYDDYGKVRLYIESHKGANAKEVEDATGVTQRSIRQMLKDSRIEVAEGSKVMMKCEACGQPIRSGQFCPQCETKMHRAMEAAQREQLMKDLKGYSISKGGEEGHRRFVRDN